MGERSKEYIVDSQERGTINISEDVVAAIAVAAALEVDGVGEPAHDSDQRKKNAVKGVKLTVGEGSVAVDLHIMVQYGHPIPQVAEAVQDAVISAVESMTELKVHCVNVRVGGVNFVEEGA